MSLIIQMLNDLDARRPRAAGAHGPALRSLGLAGPTSARARGSRPAAWLVAGLLISGIAAFLPIPRAHFPGPGAARSSPEAAVATQQAGLASAAGAENTGSTTATATPIAAPLETRAPVDDSHRVSAARSAQRAEPRLGVVVAVKDPVRVKRLSPRQRAQGRYRQALQRQRHGDEPGAERLARQALALDPGLVGARQLLSGLLIRQGRLAAAETLLDEGLRLQPHALPLAQLYARLLARRGATGQARRVLDIATATGQPAPDALALNAGILLELDDASAAAEAYRKALAARPEQGVWWMGLGLSQERSGASGPALQAYERAARLPLPARLRQFIEQRIALLREADTAPHDGGQ